MTDPTPSTGTDTGSTAPWINPPPPAVRLAVAQALAEDWLPLGDLTSSLVDPARSGRMAVVSRRPGVVAGSHCAIEAFFQVDPSIQVDWLSGDGTRVAPGDAVAKVAGPLASILTAERTALNFLCHLSGVATATRRLVDAVTAANPATRVLDTRKTLPGLRALQKAAVRAGGGVNHRATLSDGVLIKDNHRHGLSITEAVAVAKGRWPGRMVEVEADEADQAIEAAAAGATIVLLDNMSPDQVARVVPRLRAANATCLIEVSGNITIDTAPAYAAAGADLLSVGALTHSAVSLDLGLDLLAD